jgi:alpha-beta hydrolase superfamily lysophospholipase
VIIPALGRIYYQSVLGIGAGVNWANPNRAPLLLIASEKDRTVEASMVEQNLRKYSRSRATTDMRTFSGRSHLLIAEPGWEEVADYALRCTC